MKPEDQRQGSYGRTAQAEAGAGAAGSGERADAAARPDQLRARGNPEIEQVDLERGIGKLERISGN